MHERSPFTPGNAHVVGIIARASLATSRLVAAASLILLCSIVASCTLPSSTTDEAGAVPADVLSQPAQDVFTFHGRNILDSSPPGVTASVRWTANVIRAQQISPFVSVHDKALVSFVLAPTGQTSHDEWVGFGGSFVVSVPVEDGENPSRWPVTHAVDARIHELALRPVELDASEWLPWRDGVRVLIAPNSPPMGEGREHDIGTVDTEFRKHGLWTRVKCKPNHAFVGTLASQFDPPVVASGNYREGIRVGIWNFFNPTTGEIVESIDYSMQTDPQEVETVPRVRLRWRRR